MTDLVIGKGKLYFEPFLPNSRTRSGAGFAYFGNTPELTVTTDEEKLEHISSEGGIGVKDASIVTSNTRSGGFMTDHISFDNVAFWYRGAKDTTVQLAGAGVVDVWPAAVRGNYFQLGETAEQVQGARQVTVTAVAKGTVAATGTLTLSTAVPVDGDTVTVDGVAFTFKDVPTTAQHVLIGATMTLTAANLASVVNANDDLRFTGSSAGAVTTFTAKETGTAPNAYTLAKVFATAGNGTVSGATLAGGAQVAIDLEDNIAINSSAGLVRAKVNAPNIADGDSLVFTYDVAAATLTSVVDGTTTLEGRLMFVADNPVGENKDHLWPYVQLSSDGDYALIGEEWQTMGFTFEVLKLDEDTPREVITNRG